MMEFYHRDYKRNSQRLREPTVIDKMKCKLGVVAYTYSQTAWVAEARGLLVPRYLQEASLTVSTESLLLSLCSYLLQSSPAHVTIG